MEELEKQSLTSHLADLRRCLIAVMVAVGIGFAACYSVVEPLADWFFAPLQQVLPKDSSLIFTSYQEGFFFI